MENGPAIGLRDVLRRFPTGVTIVTTRDAEGLPVGLTVNSFTSVSLDPPLVLVCIDRTASSHDHLVSAPGFGVSILSARQSAIAARFAADPTEGRFDEVEWHADPHGHPRLGGAAAWLDCTLHEVLEGGDHSILIGRVEAYELGEHVSMVYHGGVFRSVEP